MDKRVHIVSPEDRSDVSLPFTLSWTVRDFDVKTAPADTGGSFAVFVDRTPVPPGKTLAWLARDDGTCATTPGCPDQAYFAREGVYETTGTQLVISTLPDEIDDEDERHRAVIVLLDDAGKRIGEIAYDVVFDVKRKG